MSTNSNSGVNCMGGARGVDSGGRAREVPRSFRVPSFRVVLWWYTEAMPMGC